ncbi:hypothetical protein ABEZ32_24045 [Bacillus mycoides]|uniref:hypothetical protein n=1 Tax=Bacillus mycoides TaxID=1405 RepID=UPI003D1E2DA1
MVLDRWLTDEEYARAAANGINRKRLQSRVYDFDWDVEVAITAPLGTVRHEYKGKNHKWLKLARANGIKTRAFHHRIKSGWGHYEAATKPPRNYKKKQIS